MLDLPEHPVLDKAAIIGGCVRLPIAIDADRLRAEVDALPASLWGTTSGRVGTQSAADAIFLRGFAPAEGPKPIEDRPPLAAVPYAQLLIDTLIPAPPQRCLLARLPGGASIPPHVDRAPYISKTIRIHVPVTSHARVWMLCSDSVYVMKPGEVWALNNSTTHAVWNADPQAPRTHLICDFLPSAALFDLLGKGERDLGQQVPEVQTHFDKIVAARRVPEKSSGPARAGVMEQ